MSTERLGIIISNFVKTYISYIVMYTALLFIFVYDSIIALTIFSIIMHIVLLIAIYTLYFPEHITFEPMSFKFALYTSVEVTIILYILYAGEHGYTFGITTATAILACILSIKGES